MNLDDQLRRYFGSSDLATLNAEAIASGIERMQVDFGLEADKGRRFALWSLMYMFGAAPDLDVAVEDDADREAARNFMDIAAGAPGL